MNIGQLVKELKKTYPSITISKIRFLEKEGLIKPKEVLVELEYLVIKIKKKLKKF